MTDENENDVFHVFHPGHSYVVTRDPAQPYARPADYVGEWEPAVYSLRPNDSVIYSSVTQGHMYAFENWSEAGRFYIDGCGSRYRYEADSGNLIYCEGSTDNGDYWSMIVGRGDTEDEALANFAQFFRNPPDVHVMHETESFLSLDEWIEQKLTEYGINAGDDA